MSQFRNLLAKLWADEAGAVIATEYLMLGSIVAAGGATGLASMRDAMVSEYQEFGQSVREIRQAYTPQLRKAKPQRLSSTDMPLVADGFDDDRPVYYPRVYAGHAP